MSEEIIKHIDEKIEFWKKTRYYCLPSDSLYNTCTILMNELTEIKRKLTANK